jgi:preprotein translocase subunit SecA
MLQAAGRPVLIGTDGVAETDALSQRLAQAGIAHRVLHALHDADEAAIVAGAGRAGSVTVATRMAGRGTDIVLDAAARAAGGLHVLNCQHNASARLDRQLLGRAARQGDPGSTETWRLARCSPHCTAGPDPTLRAWTCCLAPRLPRMPWHHLLHRLGQALEERRRAAVRAELPRQDQAWDQRLPAASPWG